MKKFKGEKVESNSKDKKVFHFHDTEKKIKQLSSEVFKKIDQVVHYPRGFEGGSKYKFIEKITFKGFKNKFPVGVNKSANLGFGFARRLKSFARYIDLNYKIKEVIIEKTGKTQLDLSGKKLYLSEASLIKLNNSFGVVLKKVKSEIDLSVQTSLHDLFPNIVSKPPKKYISNTLSTSLASWGNSINEFSEDDKEAIKDLFDKLSVKTDFLTKEAISKTKEIIDNRYIQETIKKFKALSASLKESPATEKKWQDFLRNNSWIFSSIFAQPVILHQDEAYVGGKKLDNTNGKVNDFLIKNSLSDNVSFLEIKTHKTKLLESSKYRGSDVFSASKELTGCITQVLNQRDNFQKEFYTHSGKKRVDEKFETFNSKCVILIGTLTDLNIDQAYSFELFRSNSKDVEIITFDELLKKIESLQKLIGNKTAKTPVKKKAAK